MSNFCQHCGRQLEDGELQSADGCQYCTGRNKPATEKVETDSLDNNDNIDPDLLDSLTKMLLR